VLFSGGSSPSRKRGGVLMPDAVIALRSGPAVLMPNAVIALPRAAAVMRRSHAPPRRSRRRETRKDTNWHEENATLAAALLSLPALPITNRYAKMQPRTATENSCMIEQNPTTLEILHEPFD